MTAYPPPPPATVPIWLKELVRNHPALLLTASYLALIFIGVMYEAWLFLRFRVNVLYFADASDFLMVPFREPLVMIVSTAPIPLWFLYMKVARAIVMRIPKIREKQLEAERKPQHWALAVAVAGIVLWSFAFTAQYAKYVSRRIRHGTAKSVHVEPSGGGAPIVGPLIGTTARFVFVYDAKAVKVHAVPVENIARVVLDSPQRKSDRQ